MNSCRPSLLETLLDGQLNEADEQRLISHLDSCRRCQSALERCATDDQSWRESGLLLKPQPFDEASVTIDWSADGNSGDDRLAPSIQHVIDTLAPTDDPAMLGRLGHYEVAGVVGSGGMGVVLKAFDRSLDRAVAIKVLAPHLACSGAARRRFAREAKAAAAVLHPNVIAIHGVSDGEREGTLPYLVMPYVRGPSLQARIDAEGPLSALEALRVAKQIVEGLAAAHDQGLVHRDIKPGNIMLEEGVERVSITDFGLARTVDDATLTHSGVVAGTPQYMSPEQASGEAVDARSDLFSLGSVIYAMLAGRPPFRAETPMGVMRRITDERPRPIRELNPEVPAWIDRLVGKLHAKHPDGRYASAAQVAMVLKQCIAHLNSPIAPLPAELRDPARWRRAMFVLMATLLAVGAGWVIQSTAGPAAREDAPVVVHGGAPQAVKPPVETPTPATFPWIDQSEPTMDSVWELIGELDQRTQADL